mmetsp:Transcript_40389/g.72541  ORF Transcript_40389/g.72541 Transcript_40389/m.72541 type:complete len:892 (+) Transcript_40389:103-2778(+)
MAAVKDIPRCSCCLFVCAMSCHLAVLIGNLATASMLKNMGTSASGWADVGTGMSSSISSELVTAMANVSNKFGDVLGYVQDLETGIDTMISAVGGATDTALEQIDVSSLTSQQVEEKKASTKTAMLKVVHKVMSKIEELKDMLMELLSPALNQTSAWLGQFSEKIIDYLEEFGTTVDRAQKIFDQITAQLDSSVGSNTQDMLYDTFNIFDQSGEGLIDAAEIQLVGTAYCISSISGSKADTLVEKYDENKDGLLTHEEYAAMVFDESVPDLMTSVLRAYSNKLAEIGGRVEQSTLRNELTEAVGDYLALVAGKNLTKAQWVTGWIASDRVTTRFAADLWYQFYALEKGDDVLLVEIGSLITNYTCADNATKMIEAMNYLVNTTYFVDEGFNYDYQAAAVKMAVGWVETAPGPWCKDALQEFGVVTPKAGQNWSSAYQDLAKANVEIYKDIEASSDTEEVQGTASYLQNALLGGEAASAGGTDTAAAQTAGGGQPAVTRSLVFAADLAANVSTAVEGYNDECATFSGTSSGSIDSIATKVKEFIKNTESFLELMQDYAGSTGLKKVMQEADEFVLGVESDVNSVVGAVIDMTIEQQRCDTGNETACLQYQTYAANYDEIVLDMNGAITFLTSTLGGLKTALPTVVTDLNTAKSTVMGVASTINSIMQVLGIKAPAVMTEISGYYNILWGVYFGFFAAFTCMITFYAFWSNGFFGGPQPDADDVPYQAPTGFTDRVKMLCGSCMACCGSVTSSHMCFWSMLLLGQVLTLLLFIISIVICLLIGIQAFFSAGCSKIYVITDTTVCTGMMNIFKTFLFTFGDTFSSSLDDMCSDKKLTLCKILSDEIAASALYTIIGALLASVFTFEMLLDSACKHEKIRCTHLLKNEFPNYKED